MKYRLLHSKDATDMDFNLDSEFWKMIQIGILLALKEQKTIIETHYSIVLDYLRSSHDAHLTDREED